jgi:hypothetical protein
MLKKIGGVLVAVAPAVSFAAVPEAVTTAMTAMSADSITIATAFLVASIALTAFLFMRRGAR